MKCSIKRFHQPTTSEHQAVINGHCRHCQATGENIIEEASSVLRCRDCDSTSLDSLFFHERNIPVKTHRLVLDLSLSIPQQAGSRFFVRCIQDKTPGFCQAVCGAGKTEMLFEGILMALNWGWKVCLAIPRKQVVIELFYRLKRYFPDTIIKMLHGESKDDTEAPLLVMTVHQLIQYQAEFDLVILDEIDAFPYYGNPFLERLVHKALKTDGITLMMSATMDEKIAAKIQKMGCRQTLIPSRFHGHPLDLPRLVMVSDLAGSLRQGQLPAPIKTILDEWQKDHRPVLCFVSGLGLGECFAKALRQASIPAKFLHSQAKGSFRILEEFRQADSPVLVTTTLLERGVTFPRLNVLVVDADHPLFTRDTLIQIAGRVGRQEASPTGEIRFCSHYRTKAIVEAIRMIRRMNQLKNESVRP